MIEFIGDSWYKPSIISIEIIIKNLKCMKLFALLTKDKDIFTS